MKAKQEKKICCPIIGNKKYLSVGKLLTSMDILKYYLCLNENEPIIPTFYENIVKIKSVTKILIIQKCSVTLKLQTLLK